MIVNYCKIKQLVYYHKQLEKRGDFVYMRMKKRPLIMVKNYN